MDPIVSFDVCRNSTGLGKPLATTSTLEAAMAAAMRLGSSIRQSRDGCRRVNGRVVHPGNDATLARGPAWRTRSPFRSWVTQTPGSAGDIRKSYPIS